MIQQGLTLSFKQQMLQGLQNLSSDTLRMALYTGAATLGPATTAYSTTNEVIGNGYTAGGEVVTGATISVDAVANVVYVNFNNVAWPGADFTARGALIYNQTQSDSSVIILDFGADKTFTAINNTVVMPPNTATTALIRFP